MQNTDLQRLINSDEIKRVVRKPTRKVPRRKIKPNPLKNIRALLKLNPYAAVERRQAILATELSRKRKVRPSRVADHFGVAQFGRFFVE